MLLVFFAPESPWWLIRRGRKEEALKSIKSLGTKDPAEAQRSLAMIERTVEIEANMGGAPSLLDLFKGTDLRRTIITCLIYASQNFAGNLIANQATYFFERKYSLQSTQSTRCNAKLTPNRSWNVPRPSLPTQPRQLMPPILRKHLLLVRNRMVRPSNFVPMGHSSKHRPPSNSRNLRLNRPK